MDILYMYTGLLVYLNSLNHFFFVFLVINYLFLSFALLLCLLPIYYENLLKNYCLCTNKSLQLTP